jgi:hypothetical protein
MCKKEFPCPSFDSLPRNYSLMETIDVLKNLQKTSIIIKREKDEREERNHFK